MRLENYKKMKFVFFACLSVVALSCGQPMKQTTVHMNDGSLTTADDGFKPAPVAAAPVVKPVHSTFENDCNAKRGMKTIKNEDGSRTLLLHSFCIKNASAEVNEAAQTMRFKGTADFEGYRNLKSYDFDVNGPIVKGHSVLRIDDAKAAAIAADKSISTDAEFVAVAFCNEMSESDDKNACGSFFIDLYVKIKGLDTELFDEQVADCGKADQCLAVDPAAKASPADQPTDKKADPKPADPKKDVKPDAAAKPPENAPSKVDPSVAVPALPVEEPPVQATAPTAEPLAPVDIPPAELDSKIVTEESPIPEGLEVNPDNAEEEGADLSKTPAPYVAKNTSNKINALIELFNPKSHSHDDILTESPDDVKPTTKAEPLPKKETPPKVAKNPPSKKPETVVAEKPVVEKPQPKPEVKPTAPVKNATPVKVPAEPVLKSENKTLVPDKVNPLLAKNEFPFNISIPTHGPMQVYGGGSNGWLVNPTELTEPADGEAQTYIIDTNTKNLKNRNYRKTFGAFYAVDFLKKLADFTFTLLNHPIRINDISLQHGGHLPPHSWHRVGLDADVEYSLIPQDIAHQMTPEQKWMIFQRVGASPLVNGIFVDIKDKRAACEIANLRKDYDPTSLLAMRKLKTEAGHKTHFHINFSCTYNEHCNQKEDELRGQYDKNEEACKGFKMSPAAAAQLASKK